MVGSQLHALPHTRGHKEALLALLDAGCEIDATTDGGTTLVMNAAGNGHIECLQLLIHRGADVRKADVDRLTAAHYAALYGNLAALKVLLELHSETLPSAEGWSVADCAASESRVDALSYALACGCHLEVAHFELQAAVP